PPPPGKINAAPLILATHSPARALPPGVRGKIEFLVENGVDLDVYRHASTSSPAPGNNPAPVTRFAFAGRLIGWKGVDLLLDAAKIARGHVPLHLDILGDGPWRTRLIRHAQALEIGDLVTFHGWMSHDACARIFAGSDVLVLPS